MIHIEQGQAVPENEELIVLSQSGDYDDNDLIECSAISNPGFAIYAFSSTFIKYGNIAYRFSDPLLLGEALVEIDPASTHNAAILYQEEEARKAKRTEGDFTPDNPVPVDESISPVAQEEAKIVDEQINQNPNQEIISEQTSPPVDQVVDQAAPVVSEPASFDVNQPAQEALEPAPVITEPLETSTSASSGIDILPTETTDPMIN